MPAAPKFNSRLTDLASKIYSDLVRDAMTRHEGGAKAAAEAERLARMSFEFSKDFHRVLDQLNAENEPKNVGFTVQLDDIAAWSKPDTKP